MAGTAALRARLGELLGTVARDAGYDLEDFSVTTAGRRRVLRVVVDRDGGVDLDDVAELSRLASEALDASDVMGETAYVLEVGSPGVDRPLTAPRHWRRAAGRLVRVTLHAGGSIVGRVVTADDGGVGLEVDGVPRRLPFDDIARGSVQVEFSRPEGPGVDAAAGDDEAQIGDDAEEEAPA